MTEVLSFHFKKTPAYFDILIFLINDLVPARAPASTLLRIAGCIPAFSTRGKGALGPFYQLCRVLAKARHLLQILLKAQ